MRSSHEPLRNTERTTTRIRTAPLRWAVWGLLAFVFAGCGEKGPELVPVKGKLLDSQGKPVYPGSIWFVVDGSTSSGEPDARDASSMLQEDGSFTMRTYPYGEGAMVGRYRVTLSLGAGSSPKLAKYSGPRTSPITLDVPKEGISDRILRLDADSKADSGRGGPPGARRPR